MTLISDLNYSLFAVRKTLRERFARLQNVPPHSRFRDEEKQFFPNDVDVLQLLLDTKLTKNSDAQNAINRFNNLHAHSVHGLPNFEEAEARGWFRQIWGALSHSTQLRDFTHYANPSYASELDSYRHWLHGTQYQIKNIGTHATASGFEGYIATPNQPNERQNILSPGWIAARLWDLAETTDLKEWTMRWDMLERPMILPDVIWSQQRAQQFRQMVVSTLVESNLPGWEDLNLLGTFVHTGGDIRKADPVEVASDLLGRYLEASSNPSFTELYESDGLIALLGILAHELPHIEIGPVPSSSAESIIELAMGHPDILDALIMYCKQAPKILADIIHCPRAVTLVTYLVGSWSRLVPPNRGEETSAIDSMNLSLFEDCLSVLKNHLFKGSVSPAEFANLLVALRSLDASGHNTVQRFPLALECLHGMQEASWIEVRSQLIVRGCVPGNTSAFAVMLNMIAIHEISLQQKEAFQIAKTYQTAINSFETVSMTFLDQPAAAALVRIAMLDTNLRDIILYPLNIGAALKATKNTDHFKIALALREHIRVLCRAVIGYPESIPEVLVQSLERAIQSGAADRANKRQVDAFSIQLFAYQKTRVRRLEADVADAVCRLENLEQQKRLVRSLEQVEEPLVLAVLLQRLPRIHHESMRQRLEQLTPANASSPTWITQTQERISALLDVGMPATAQTYLQALDSQMYGKNSPDLIIERMRAQLQLYYLQGDFSKISEVTVPDGLSGDRCNNARNTIDFYKALVLLQQSPAVPSQAAAIFNRLYYEEKNPSYAINLMAARIQMYLEENTFRTLTGQAAIFARKAIAEADAAIPDIKALSTGARAVHAPNCAALLLAIGNPRESLRRLEGLDPSERSAESMIFEAVANQRAGDHDRALSLIRTAKECFGQVEIVIGGENHILHSSPYSVKSGLVSQEEITAQIRAALKIFAGMSPARQAAVLVTEPLPLEHVIASEFRDALSAFQRLVSMLHLDKNTFHEDDYNGLVAELAQARVESIFGWQANEQSPSGFTKKGNAGRRDFVLRRRGVDIAVFEGLKSDQPNDANIKGHFHKLLGYSATDLFLHVTYSFRKLTSEMFDAVKLVVAQPPPGVTLVSQSQIAAEGARPAYTRGAYRRGGNDVTVLFFVVDMVQHDQRQAVGAPSVLALPVTGTSTVAAVVIDQTIISPPPTLSAPTPSPLGTP